MCCMCSVCCVWCVFCVFCVVCCVYCVCLYSMHVLSMLPRRVGGTPKGGWWNSQGVLVELPRGVGGTRGYVQGYTANMAPSFAARDPGARHKVHTIRAPTIRSSFQIRILRPIKHKTRIRRRTQPPRRNLAFVMTR